MNKKIFVIIPLLIAILVGFAVPFAAQTDRTGYTASRDTYFLADEPYSEPILTFEAWVNIPNRIVGSFSRMIVLSTYGWYNETLSFGVTKDGCPCIIYSDSERTVPYNFTDGDVREEKWMHMAITIDAEAKIAYAYVNGELVGERKIDFDPLKTYSTPYMMANDSTSAKIYAFRGQLSSVTVYSDMRTADEIAADMNSDTPDTDNLIAHYDLSGDVSEVAKDISGRYDMKFVDQWIAESAFDNDYAYTFVAVPDTQKLNIKYPEEFKKIYNWLYDNVESQKVKMVMSMGDITDEDLDREWTLAAEYIRLLDGLAPYTLLTGNHDSAEKLDEYFPYEEYAERLAGSFEESVRNSWQEVVIGDIKYMIMALDYKPSDEVLAWANEEIAAHPEHNVIVTTHAYLFSDGDYNGQGERIWENLVSKHANIVLVLCGHEDSDPILMKKSTGVNGNVVTQLLIDGQNVDKENTPAGLVALLHFSEDGRTVNVEYFSTVKEMYFTPESQFTMELPVIMPESPVAGGLANPVIYIVIGVVAVGIAVAVILIVKKKK